MILLLCFVNAKQQGTQILRPHRRAIRAHSHARGEILDARRIEDCLLRAGRPKFLEPDDGIEFVLIRLVIHALHNRQAIAVLGPRQLGIDRVVVGFDGASGPVRYASQ